MKFISTSGHGYLRVTKKQLQKAMNKGYKPTGYSLFNDKCAMLEEDVDLGNFLNFYYIGKEIPKTFSTVYQNDINRDCYNYFN